VGSFFFPPTLAGIEKIARPALYDLKRYKTIFFPSLT